MTGGHVLFGAEADFKHEIPVTDPIDSARSTYGR
jgi:hypothetical protein